VPKTAAGHPRRHDLKRMRIGRSNKWQNGRMDGRSLLSEILSIYHPSNFESAISEELVVISGLTN
jgi:hypothetical protein